jgi:hydrogenase expression/formation protein HypC
LRVSHDLRRPVAAAGGNDMCLAVPMKIKSVDGFNAVCEAKGIEREVSLFMLQGEEVAVDDHVLVHVGYAIQKVSEEEARLTWELFEEIENA